MIDSKISTLVMDERAVRLLSRADLEDTWFTNFALSYPQDGVEQIRIRSSAVLLSFKSDENARLLIIRLDSESVFGSIETPSHVFNRILHVALAKFERTVSIPIAWKPFFQGSKISIYAQSHAVGGDQRVYIDRRPEGSDNVYAYAITEKVRDFPEVPYDKFGYLNALNDFLDALIETKAREGVRPPGAVQEGSFRITLFKPIDRSSGQFSTLSHWLEKGLTREQQKFVERDNSGPVRLRGAAGTGKTLSLAAKCLKDAYALERTQTESRLAFITHSVQMANERVREMFFKLDPSEHWASLSHVKIDLKSLYEIAQEILSYDSKGVKPISLDGAEGREYQKMYIDQSINKLTGNTILQLRYLNSASPEFKTRLTSPTMRSRMLDDLANEFASVIDAEVIRAGNTRAESYLAQKRDDFQMPLKTLPDREIVLQIHKMYCQALIEDNYLSMDQMIADLNSYLGSNEWRVRREDLGYNLVFVDELHFFNKAECMVFHMLFRTRAVGDGGRVPLFMAYDLKQSPTDALLSQSESRSASSLFRSIGAGETELIELTKVFRFTPQISRFIDDLDGAFPALDLEGEWRRYAATSAAPDGATPELHLSRNPEEMLDAVFARAARAAQGLGGREVAVLSLNNELFCEISQSGPHKGKVLANRFKGWDLRAEIRRQASHF